MIFKKLIFLFFILFSLNLVFAIKPAIDIKETSQIKGISDGRYSVYSSGTIEITNPSSISKIYEIDIPLELDSLIGVNKIRIDNTSDRFTFSFNRIKGFLIEPNSSVRVGYNIYGIVNYDLNKETKDKGISIFEYYAEDFGLYANTIVSLEKSSGENYNLDGSINESSTPINFSRLVSANFRNPSDFDYFIKDIKLYGTSVDDPYFSDGDLLDSNQNISVLAYGYEEFNFVDPSSNGYAVYWVSNDVTIDTNLNSQVSWKSSSGGGSSKSSSNNGGLSTPDFKPIVIKKEVDKTLVRNGDEFEVILKIVNVNNFALYNLSLEDIIPENYEIKDVSSKVKIVGGDKLYFEIEEILEYETYIIKYTLVNNDDLKGITYLKPAKAIYDNTSYFSDGVLVINDLLPDKKLFIQKEVDYQDDEYARVTITVKNLGASEMNDILVSDILDENSVIKEISQVFLERGVWKIKSLRGGEEWSVTYLIERNSELDNLPNIFGVDDTEVFGTLISSEEIITIFREEPRTVEKVGMALAVGLLIFYLLF